jgi:hypothetical protein
MNSDWQKVWGITGYWDGCRCGVVNYEGQPHVFESDIEGDDGVQIFLLKCIDEETLNLFRESFEIWLRWKKAFHEGTLSADDKHPSLAVDRARNEELERLLKPRLSINAGEGFEVAGVFRYESEGETSRDKEMPLEVRWSKVRGRHS